MPRSHHHRGWRRFSAGPQTKRAARFGAALRSQFRVVVNWNIYGLDMQALHVLTRVRRGGYGLDLSSILFTIAAMVWPFATCFASLAAAAGVSITAICFPPASARALRLRAWRWAVFNDVSLELSIAHFRAVGDVGFTVKVVTPFVPLPAYMQEAHTAIRRGGH